MSLLLPCQTGIKNDNVTFGCCSTHAAVGYPNYIIIFTIQNNNLIFDFSLETEDSNAPYLCFNENTQSSSLLLAAFSKKKSTFIDINCRKIISTIDSGCEYFIWDPLLNSAFFRFTVNGILEHCTLNDESKKKHIVNWTNEFPEPPIRMLIHPNSPNSFFVLTLDGSLYHYARSNSKKLPRIIRVIKFDDIGQKFIDIYHTYLDFIILISPHRIAFYHYLKYKLVWMINTPLASSNFLRAYSHPSNPKYLFILLENRLFCMWKFSQKTGQFLFSKAVFEFKAFDKKFIRSIFIFGKGFIFFTRDLTISFVEFLKGKLFLRNSHFVPLISAQSKVFAFNGSHLAYSHHTNHIHIIDTKTFALKKRIKITNPILNMFWYEKDALVYTTISAVSVIFLKPFFKEQILLSSHRLSGSSDSLLLMSSIQNYKENMTVRLGDNCILSFDLNSPKKDLYTIKNTLLHYEIIPNGETFALALQVEEDVTTIFSSKGQLIQTIYSSFNEIAGFIYFDNKIGVYFKSGNLVFENESLKLEPAEKVIFSTSNNILVCASLKSIFVFRFVGEFVLIMTYNEANSILYSFDGDNILILNQEKIMKVLKLSENEKPAIPKIPVFWPSFDNIEEKYMKISLKMTAKILSLLEPVPDDVTEIRFLLDLKTEFVKLVEGENPSRLFRNIFLCFANCELSEEQKEEFTKCAEMWQSTQRYVNAAVLYHFLKQYEKAAKCLIEIRYFELALYYSKLHNSEENVIYALMKSALYKNIKGEVVNSAVLAIKAKEYHIALHFLYVAEMYSHINDVLEKYGDSIKETEQPIDVIGFQITPLETIKNSMLQKMGQ